MCWLAHMNQQAAGLGTWISHLRGLTATQPTRIVPHKKSPLSYQSRLQKVSLTAPFCWTILRARYMRQLSTSVRRPSVPFRGYISKTKQDRLIVTVKHYTEVGTANSVATFRSSSVPTRPSRKIFWCQLKMFNTFPVHHSVRRQLLSTEFDRLLLKTEYDGRSEPVVHNHHWLRWQHSWYDASFFSPWKYCCFDHHLCFVGLLFESMLQLSRDFSTKF